MPMPYMLHFGWPFDWISQQSTLTPPLPFSIGLGNPMENATTVDWSNAAADAGLFWLMLFAVALALMSLTTGRRRGAEPPRPESTSGTQTPPPSDDRS
jgi:hypothetical protein